MFHFKSFISYDIAFKSMVLGKVLGNYSKKANLPLLKKKVAYLFGVFLVVFYRCSAFIEAPIFISPEKEQKLSKYFV